MSTTLPSKKRLSILKADIIGKLTPVNLLTGYVPYKSSTHLIDSPIFTNATSVSIGNASPLAKLHITGIAAGLGDALRIDNNLNSLVFSVKDNGSLWWGSSSDANLYRDAANRLKTDWDFTVGRTLTVSGPNGIYAAVIQNPATGLNSKVLLNASGAEVQTSIDGNIALTVTNTSATSTANLQHWVKGTATIAKLTSDSRFTLGIESTTDTIAVKQHSTAGSAYAQRWYDTDGSVIAAVRGSTGLETRGLGNLGSNNLIISGNPSLILNQGNGNTGAVVIGANNSADFTAPYTNTERSGVTISRPVTPFAGTDNLTFNLLQLNNVVNFTGAVNSKLRGLYINPTTTNVSDFRAIETVTGNILLATTSGNVAIGRATVDTAFKLDVGGKARVSNEFSIESAVGKAILHIKTDPNNTNSELDNPYIRLSQDGDLVTGIIGLNGQIDEGPDGTAITGLSANNLVISSPYTGTAIQFATGNALRATIGSTGLSIVGAITATTHISATGNISAAGNLSGVDIASTGNSRFGGFAPLATERVIIEKTTIGAVQQQLRLLNSGTTVGTGTQLTLSTNNNSGGTTSSIIKSVAANTTGAVNLIFGVSPNGSTIPDRLTIFGTSGNVTIGDAADAGFKLDVTGTGRFTEQLVLGSITDAPAIYANTSGGSSNNFIFDFNAGGIRRSTLTRSGSQHWYLHNGTNEVGTIGYTTPTGRVGIVFFDSSSSQRTQIVHRIGGGINFGGGAGSGDPGTSMTLTAEGRLGIGTTSPTHLLEVSGTTRFAGNVTLDGYSATLNEWPTPGTTFKGFVVASSGGTSHSNGNAAFATTHISPVAGFVKNGYSFYTGGSGGVLHGNPSFQIRHTIGTAIGSSLSEVHTDFMTNTTVTGSPFSAMRIVGQSGNILIGTTTDSGFKFDVNGTSRFTGNMSLTGSLTSTSNVTSATYVKATTGIFWGNLDTAGVIAGRANVINYVYQNNVGRILSWDGTSYYDLAIGDWNDANPNIMLKKGGNVGIGLGTPTHRLDVAGTGRFSDELTLTSPNATSLVINRSSASANANISFKNNVNTSGIFVGAANLDTASTGVFAVGVVPDLTAQKKFWVDAYTGNTETLGTIKAAGLITGSGFKTTAGTASQFLKADGSVDGTLYTPTTRTVTINGTALDLSSNRAWDIDHVRGTTITNLTNSNFPQVQGIVNFHRFNNGATDQFPGVTDNANAVININSHNGGYGKQIGFGNNDDLYMRKNSVGVMGQWRKILHDGNFVAGTNYQAAGSYFNLAAQNVVSTQTTFTVTQVINTAYNGLLFQENGTQRLHITTTGQMILGDNLNVGLVNASNTNWFRPQDSAGNMHLKVTDVAKGIYHDAKTHYFRDQVGGTSNNTDVQVYGSLNADRIGVRNVLSNTGLGISLYGGPNTSKPTYGIMFAGTNTFGTHGSVTSDWATYFTMNDQVNRGWIFQRGGTNVASISTDGHLALNGNATINGTMTAAKSRVLGSQIGAYSAGNILVVKNLCNYSSNIPNATGAIIIKTGVVPNTQTMTKTRVKGYLYTTTKMAFDIEIGYYNYGANPLITTGSGVVYHSQYRPSVSVYRNAAKEVFFVIGAITDTHSYPKYWVDEFVGGYNGVSDTQADGWTMTVAADLVPYAFTENITLSEDKTFASLDTTNTFTKDIRFSSERIYFGASSNIHLYGNTSTSTINFVNGAAATGAKMGSLVVSPDFASSAPANGIYSRGQISVQDVPQGTAPFIVGSTTQVTNLNAHYVGGIDQAKIVYGNGGNATSTSSNPDTINKSGFWRVLASGYVPEHHNLIQISDQGDSTSSQAQLAFSTTSHKVGFRYKTNVWQSWVDILHTGNFVAGTHYQPAGSYQEKEDQRLSTTNAPTFSGLTVNGNILTRGATLPSFAGNGSIIASGTDTSGTKGVIIGVSIPYVNAAFGGHSIGYSNQVNPKWLIGMSRGFASENALVYYEDSAAAKARFVLFPDGNVAIGGTTDAGFKLDVQGSIRTTGIITSHSDVIMRDNRDNSVLVQSPAATTSNRLLTLGNATYNRYWFNSGQVVLGSSEPATHSGFQLDVTGTTALRGQVNTFAAYSAGTGADFFSFDINPSISAGANNQKIALLRLRDRGANGVFTGVVRPLLVSENAGGGTHSVQLFETGLRLGYTAIAAPTSTLDVNGSTLLNGLVTLGGTSHPALTKLFSVLDNNGVETYSINNTGDVTVGKDLFVNDIYNRENLNNAAINLSTSGSIVHTSVLSNIALKIRNTSASATGDLLQLITGTTVVAKVSSVGDATFNQVYVGRRGTTNSTGVGQETLLSRTTGDYNTALGYRALMGITTGNSNTGVGNNALYQTTTGGDNVAVGMYSLFSNIGGLNSTATGNYSLRNSTANNNTAFGAWAGFELTTGIQNTFIGYNTGRGITTGSLNTILGANVTGLSPTLSNHIIIADGTGNQRIVVDNTGVLKLNNIQVFDSSSKLYDSALSSNVALKNVSNVFTATQVIEGNNLELHRPDVPGGWARGVRWFEVNGAAEISGLWTYGSGSTIHRISLGVGSLIYGSDNALHVHTSGNTSIGTTSSLGRLHVKGLGNTTGTALYISNSDNTELLKFLDNGELRLKGTLIFDVNSKLSDSALSSNIPLKNVNNTFTGSIHISRTLGVDAFSAWGTGDSTVRLAIRTDGTFLWSGGTGSMDTNLYRSGINTLKTDSNLHLIDASHLVTGDIRNSTSFNNARIRLFTTGTEISTGISSNTALKVINTLSGASGNLTEWVDGTNVVAKVTSSGEGHFTNIKINGSDKIVNSNTVAPEFMLGVFEIPYTEKAKLRDVNNWNADTGTYIGAPLIDCMQGQYVCEAGIDVSYTYLFVADNMPIRMLRG
jgi:hypothetical protein